MNHPGQERERSFAGEAKPISLSAGGCGRRSRAVRGTRFDPAARKVEEEK